MTGNLTRDLPADFLATWGGCSHLDCLPECVIRLEGGHCERLGRALKAWATTQCPKCLRIRNDWDCAEDGCPMAAGERQP